MPDPTPTRPRLRAALLLAATLAGAALAGFLGRPVVLPPPPPPAADVAGPDDVIQTFGWVPDAEAIRANLDPLKTEQFDQTPAGKAVMGDEDSFLWRPAAKLNGGKFPSVNQLTVGCCVGCGFKHGADACQGVQVARTGGEFKPVSVEVIYGGSRVEVGGGRLSGDGSVGSWAARFVRDWGVVPMAAHPGADLTTFSPARARQYGQSGVPDALEPLAREHPVKGVALAKSWADVKKAVQQGYPVAVCSNQGFTMTRDAAGFARPQGSWAHCMCVLGVRGGPRPGGFVLNSWGDQAHTGGVWPPDMPVAGFWAEASVIDRMVSQGDSFALADMVGFPARPLDWNVNAAPVRPRRATETDYALAP